MDARVRCWPAVVAFAAAAVLLAWAPVARADVQLGSDTVVVRAPGASAVVQLHPFRMQFSDGAGRSVLSEVDGSGAGPMVLPPTADPVAPGSDNPSTATLYAPLSFLVGDETVRQYEGGLWGGNLLSGVRAGIQYSARDAVSAERAGNGARIVVSTSDPTGRRLVVTVAPAGRDAIGVSVRPDPDAGVVQLGDSFGSAADEGFFGFGGRHDAIDHHGQTFSSFIDEENVGGVSGANGSLALFPNGPQAAYYPQAQFISSRRYGFLLDRPELARFKLASDRPDAWNVTVSASGLDYVVAPGGAKRAIGTLTALGGRQPAPPRWALGPMFDRLAKNIGESQADYEANLHADLRDIAHYRLPLTAYRIEGWGDPAGDNGGLSLTAFTSPNVLKKTIAELRRRHIHPLVYLRPWANPGSEAVKNGWVATNAAGQPYYTTGTAGQPFALVDFTNPQGVAYWQRQVRHALDTGADGFMQDFGEEVLFDMHFADGESGITMHNRYLNLYARATRQAVDQYARAHPGRHPWFFTRAGYSGRPGAAAWEGGNFPGDETTDWSTASGIASLTPDMLGRAVGGAYGFGTDIGGYFDYNTPPTTKELFLRWTEWAALSPVFRLHGAGRTGTHTPWSFDRQTVTLYNRLSRLHLKAVPLILRLWRSARRTGIPPTRPLWLANPGDPTARAQTQEWMLGNDVLVAPVVVEGARARSVYFPRGCWRQPGSKRRHEGPAEATVRAPLGTLPYFVRCHRHPFATHP